MEKGLPRPLNRHRQPVPYVASGPDDLGNANDTRVGEVIGGALCQVCGEPLTGDVVAVFDLRPHMAALLDRPRQGFSHDRPCYRLAAAHCPFLADPTSYRVIRMPVAEMPELVSGILTIPVEVQLRYEVTTKE